MRVKNLPKLLAESGTAGSRNRDLANTLTITPPGNRRPSNNDAGES